MTSYSYQELLEDIERHGRNLTEWEAGFVDSVSKHMGSGKSLSPRQAEILKRIHTEKVG